MASRKKKREVCMGAVLVAAGCILRSVQLLGAYFGAGFVSHRVIYIAMLCLLCGGFAVLAYEKKGKASFWAIAASAVSLLSTVMGNMSSGNDALRVLSAVFLVATFIAAGFHCFAASKGNNLKVTLGAVTVVLAVACGVFAAGISVAPAVILAVLVAAYITTGVAVII